MLRRRFDLPAFLLSPFPPFSSFPLFTGDKASEMDTKPECSEAWQSALEGSSQGLQGFSINIALQVNGWVDGSGWVDDKDATNAKVSRFQQNHFEVNCSGFSRLFSEMGAIHKPLRPNTGEHLALFLIVQYLPPFNYNYKN